MTSPVTRLVLLGGGHAHVFVLAEMARQRFRNTEVVLLTPYRRQIYSGMLPGWIAGRYGIDECALPLDRLAEKAGVRLVTEACTGIDLARRLIHCASGSQLAFDLLSINCGSQTRLTNIPGATAHALPIRPIEGFVNELPQLLNRIRDRHPSGRPAAAPSSAQDSSRPFSLHLIGDGAAGVELALALRTRLATEGLDDAKISLIGPESLPLRGFPPSARRLMAKILQQRKIDHLGTRQVREITGDQIVMQGGDVHPANAIILTTGAAAPDWMAASGLATDDKGFVRVDTSLRSLSHPFVFAAGDAAAYATPRPKSGVFAVRAGPPLAENLRVCCETGNREDPASGLIHWRPQHRALYLLNTGDGRALACHGGLSAVGPWAWRWKDRIDRRFIARFSA